MQVRFSLLIKISAWKDFYYGEMLSNEAIAGSSRDNFYFCKEVSDPYSQIIIETHWVGLNHHFSDINRNNVCLRNPMKWKFSDLAICVFGSRILIQVLNSSFF